jgi:hypothetical protein
MIHETIVEAVESATADAGQPSEVARQLISWLETVADGSESFEDREAVSRRCEFLYDSVLLENGDDE